jgi:hypothetical protein
MSRVVDFRAGGRPTRQQVPRHDRINAERILRAFNTRAFKRQQPDNPELMLDIILESIARKSRVPLILYWGKGLRGHLGEPELASLAYLAAIDQRVRQIYEPGAKITLIFTDTHAELNGHPSTDVLAYFEELRSHAHDHGFEVSLMSQLMRGVELAEYGAMEVVPPKLLTTLCHSASKWYRGAGTVEDGAIRYYRLNMIERRVVQRIFPRAIFVTFNGSELRSLFPPSLPIFYMFSVRHGVSDKPWFLPADFVSRHADTGLAQSA